jgi:nucleoside-diphosphate-sugar epimerase
MEDPTAPRSGASRGPILVTGAAGFIGGALARRLAEAGRPVAALDLPGRPTDHLRRPGIAILEGDVTSRGDCDRALAAAAPAAVVHCAALMGGFAPPAEYLRVNAHGSETLAEACAAASVRRFVYLSSVTVHGLPARRGITEDDPLRSIGLAYADSKIAAEERLLRIHQRGGIRLTILRPGDVHGPRSVEWVVKLVEALRARRMILVGGGRGLVNVAYVDNLADAVCRCLDAAASEGRTYLITDGPPVTWRRYLDALAAAAGLPPPRLSIPAILAPPLVLALEAAYRPLGRRPPLGRMGLKILTARCSYSIERARRELGWEPAVGFEEGMRRIAVWLRSPEASSPGPR